MKPSSKVRNIKKLTEQKENEDGITGKKTRTKCSAKRDSEYQFGRIRMRSKISTQILTSLWNKKKKRIQIL